MMRIGWSLVLAVAGLGASVPGAAVAQAAAAQEVKPLEIGAVAPDFALPGATRYGVLKEPIKLSDFRGKTVVLAFFFRARTKG